MITLFLNEVERKLGNHGAWKSLLARCREGRFPCSVFGPQGSFLALTLNALRKACARPFLVVVPTGQEAESLAADLSLFGVNARVFPWWGNLPYKQAASSSPVFGQRVRVLNDILRQAPAPGASPVVIVPLRSFLTPVPDPEYLRQNSFAFEKGAVIDTAACSRSLQAYGYLRVPRVSVPGEFALRGEVLDIFMPGYEDALRIVFEFDTVEDIRFFSVESQVSTQAAGKVTVFPLREVLWTDERISLLEENLGSCAEAKKVSSLVEELIERRSFPGEEMLYPLAFDKAHNLTEYLPPDAVFLYVEDERLQSAADALRREYEGLYAKARAESPFPPPAKILFELDKMRSLTPRCLRFTLLKEENGASALDLRAELPRSFFGNLDFFREELQALQQADYSVFIFADTPAQAQRITHILPKTEDADKVTVIPESLSGGFTFAPAKIAVIQEAEIFGRRRRIPASVKTVESRAIDSFIELSAGVYVVHVNYGIGRFGGIQRIKAAGNERDYIQLEYAGEEYVYIPIEQVNLIQRYIGHEGNAPRLDTLGGKSWENRKNRVRKSVEDIAARLIDLYSKRKKARGFAFPRDTEWQLEFEAAFPYEETTDQLTCIAEVKEDMEKPVPMDRMVCGDVGYGKTEIALRAAFKAVTAGKQVAILAPTTILAEQHFETITGRIRKYPVHAAMLSRFVSKKSQKAVLEGLRRGTIDLVVGTHRLLQKDVAFHDIGLLVVDEEQRFGVKDKERLKEIKTCVDSLTLTATPIPRTLHMSLLKIRDMSVLKTPPSGRLPIETHIMEFSPEAISLAIRHETARGGQVYYLHNRTQSLEDTQLFVQSLVPEALVDIAHGKMSAENLEDIMHRFIHGGIQVLVSTTIIENGIDIPNVNTIIIDRADMY
ncbi:MAG: transcription-repair coupling factor, partial [Spirochaetaceae bacterium]|nr:transcription-repair coupling factor [Spirochaetaceae bacterium]